MKFQLDPNDPNDKKIIRAIAEEVVAIQDERKPVEEIKPEPIVKDAVLSIREAHNITGIKTATLRAHIKIGLLKASRPGKHYLIHQSDLDEYLHLNQK